jgi:ATP-binding cassette, subfamily B, multidrug efflux pump
MSASRQKSIHDEEKLGTVFEPHLIARLLRYLKPYRIKVGLAIFFLMSTAGLEQLSPYLTKVAIDDHIMTGDFPGLVKVVIIFIILYLLITVIKVAQVLITGWVGEQVMLDIRQEIFAHIQKQSLKFFDKNPVGRLVTRTTSDVQTLSEIFSSGIVVVFGDVFTLIGIIVAMLLLNWKLALVSFVVVPPMLFITFFFRTRLRKVFRDVRVRTAAISSFLQEHLSGIRIVQLFNHEARTESNFAEKNSDARTSHLKTVALFSVFFPMMEIMSSFAIALIIVRGGFLTLNEGLSIGVVIAFLQYTERFFRPIRELAEKWNIFQSGIASAERVFDLLDHEPGIVDKNKTISLDSLNGSVEFRDVRFSYNNSDEVLKGVNFKIESGETVAIVGATGAGKSTIINLIARFYDVNEGSVLVDDVDVRDWSNSSLLDHMAYVSQDVFLFSGTIRDNITLGDNFSDEEVNEAINAVNADKFITTLPGKLDEPVTERGSTLSSGQRQLLAFARAMVRNPKIMVLDEATSSIDPETENLIQDALKTLMKGRTSFIVAHRLSTIKRADKILVMHKGCLRELGTHDELLAQKGIYWRLFRLQNRQVA